MTFATRELGQFGEELASEFLQDQGYTILARNWRSNRVELDIVAQIDTTLVFCEVKTRRSSRQGLPIEAITNQKLQNLKKAALSWLVENRSSYKNIRFDVVGIILGGSNEPKISHVQGIGT